MKKIKFYSLCRINGHVKALWHDGYTDGIYNYYKNNNDHVWYAIIPKTGLSAASGFTMKETAEKANSPEVIQKVEHAMKYISSMKMEEFQRAIDKAM